MIKIVIKLLLTLLITASIGSYGMNDQENFHKEKRDGTKRKTNFRLEKMNDQTLTSGDRATFKCKVDLYEKYPVKNFTFVWYKDNTLIESDYDRLTIKQKTWGSQMRISDVYSSDSGNYACEASYGSTRANVNSKLNVGFNLVPEDAKKTEVDKDRLKGTCEIYKGNACDKYFGGKYVYIEAFSNQIELDESVNRLPGVLHNAKVSSRCSKEFIRTSCYFLFAMCDPSVDEPLPLCREDCEILKYDICRKELEAAKSNDLLNEAFQTDCTNLPPTYSSRSDKCTKIHENRAVVGRHKCYNETGEGYKGTLSITSSGETCSIWPNDMLQKYPSLAGGHNFCRNPNKKSSSPWCYVNNRIENCQVPKCDEGKNDLLKILIPAVSLPLLIACLVFIFCNVCRHKNNQKQQPTKGVIVKQTNSIIPKKALVPELMPSNILVINEIGEGKLGKIFKAQMVGNYNFGTSDPVAVKTLRIGLENEFMDEFQKEIEIFSDLQHTNIASLKGMIMQPSLRCMIFEYTAVTDLHEYLTMHNPNGDFSSNLSQSSSSFDSNYFIRMISEISAGMEYLSSKNFIHRDLAARNILVCSNMTIKISNLGFIQDSSLSNYYRSPQGGQMLPIRWMSPESLHSWQFSNKSAVWSFGVVLWEMYSFGMQPYCGYSNHEVLAMIGRRRLLSCPDQCPSKIYSLMMECWYENATNRPSFKEISLKLVGWESAINTRVTSQLAQGIHRQLDQLKQGDAVIRQMQSNHQNINNQNIRLPPMLRQNIVSGNDSSVESSSNAFVSLKNYPSYHVNNQSIPVNNFNYQSNNFNYPANNKDYQVTNQPNYNGYQQRNINENLPDYQSSRQSSSVYSKSNEGSVKSQIKEHVQNKQGYPVNTPLLTNYSRQENLHTNNQNIQQTECDKVVFSPTNSHRKQIKLLENSEGDGEKKTTSCDSGLPVEGEFGSDGADSAKPLINKNTG